jgi:alpha-tubulin suppressor-like RCC1 family protein
MVKEITLLRNVKYIASGKIQVLAVTDDGAVWSFHCLEKVLDQKRDADIKHSTPQKKNLLGRKAFAVAAGASHFFALCEE